MSLMLERIKELRKENSFNQKHVSKYLNVTISSYSGYETGKYQPNIDILSKLAELYNVTLDYLIGKTDLKISPEELALLNDIDLGNDEILKKHNLWIGDHKLTSEELGHFIALIKIAQKKV